MSCAVATFPLKTRPEIRSADLSSQQMIPWKSFWEAKRLYKSKHLISDKRIRLSGGNLFYNERLVKKQLFFIKTSRNDCDLRKVARPQSKKINNFASNFFGVFFHFFEITIYE